MCCVNMFAQLLLQNRWGDLDDWVESFTGVMAVTLIWVELCKARTAYEGVSIGSAS